MGWFGVVWCVLHAVCVVCCVLVCGLSAVSQVTLRIVELTSGPEELTFEQLVSGGWEVEGGGWRVWVGGEGTALGKEQQACGHGVDCSH